uniref:Matrix extracellular phosphoglycoprotein n=1 Tax=Aotus nancymaae TaxID=37293 RepID=A0A2K5E3P4_AOTNA
MRVFCVGLLLFSVTWAAPTFRPQTEKTEQSCVEEQRSPGSSSLSTTELWSQNLPDPHPMPWPTSRSASGPAAAGVILEDPRCPWTKKTKTILVFTIWARE